MVMHWPLDVIGDLDMPMFEKVKVICLDLGVGPTNTSATTLYLFAAQTIDRKVENTIFNGLEGPEISRAFLAKKRAYIHIGNHIRTEEYEEAEFARHRARHVARLQWSSYLQPPHSKMSINPAVRLLPDIYLSDVLR
jgi:hypothetical protein